MKSRLQLFCLVAIILLVLPGCSSAAKKGLPVNVDIGSSGEIVTLMVGGTLNVTLDSNIRMTYDTEDYRWDENANIGDITVIQQIDHKPQVNNTPGADEKETWTFKALKTGQSTISMGYRLPGEPPMEVLGIIGGVNVTPSPIKLFTLTIVVKSATK